MARLALSVAGGIIGAILALPTGGVSVAMGWSIGAAVGGVIGALAFPGKSQHIYGARLNDTNVSSSAPGAVIPILYGSMRLGGQIIWSKGIQEVKTDTKQSAKGGPTVTTTNYTYFCTFAAAFCQGPASVARVWGDAKLIYDTTGTGQLAKNINVVPVIYPGDETQLADPTIVSAMGASNTPAYRGVCYAVWEKFPLANFGNRLPNIRAEVTTVGADAYPYSKLPLAASMTGFNGIAVDESGQTAFVWEAKNGAGAQLNKIWRVDLTNNEIVASGTLDFSGVGLSASAFHGNIDVDADGYLIVGCPPYAVKVDPWTFKALSDVYVGSIFFDEVFGWASHAGSDGKPYHAVVADQMILNDFTATSRAAVKVINTRGDSKVTPGFSNTTPLFVDGRRVDNLTIVQVMPLISPPPILIPAATLQPVYVDCVGATKVVTNYTGGLIINYQNHPPLFPLWFSCDAGGAQALGNIEYADNISRLPAFLGELVGKWADNSGPIGTDRWDVVLGNHAEVTPPPGATKFYIGVVRDSVSPTSLFNSGGFTISVTVSADTVDTNRPMAVVGQHAWLDEDRFTQSYPVVGADDLLYFISEKVSGTSWTITKINPRGGVTPIFTLPYKGPFYLDVVDYSYPAISTQGIGRAMFWNESDNTLIVLTDVGALLKIDAATGAILDQVGSNTSPQFYVNAGIIGSNWLQYGGTNSAGGFTNNDRVVAAFGGKTLNGKFWVPSLANNSHAIVMAASDFSVQGEIDLQNWTPVLFTAGAGSTPTYQPTYYKLDRAGDGLLSLSTTSEAGGIFNLYHVFFNRKSAGGTDAASIVADICAKAGIDPSNIDVTKIAGLSVKGFPIVQLQTGKDIINTLGQTLFFEARESDFKLQFIPRGQSPTLNIPETDLGLDSDKTKLTEAISQEQDAPKVVEIIYTDPALDYQQNKQHKIRHHRTKKTTNKTSVSLPIVMSAAEAVQLADKLLWVADVQRYTYKLNLWKAYYLLLDPCDVITCDYNGISLSARLADNTVGANYATSFNMVKEDLNAYLTSQSGNGSTGFVPQFIQNLAQTLLFILDMPYLQDQDADATGNTGFYFGMAPASGGAWSAGVLYSSSDNAAFNQLDASSTKIAYGTVQNALAAPPRGPWTWDAANSLTLRMVLGDAPASDTPLNVLNGTNAAILYPSLEVIQFTTVVNNGDGTYTLSGLLRGRRGTEWACGSHAAGETIIFPLNGGGVVHEPLSLSLLNLLRYYRPITVGADLNSNPNSQQVTVVGRDLMPYAPTAIAGNLSGGDWTFGWLRRTRINGAWLDSYGDVPLNEDGQGYAVEITDSLGAVKRTAVVTSNRFTYTSAMQSEDFGGNQATVYLNVYQVSAQVGRGFKASATITGSAVLPPVDSAPPLANAGTAAGGSWLVNGV